MKARTSLAAMLAASLLAVPALSATSDGSGRSYAAPRTVQNRAVNRESAQQDEAELQKLVNAGIDLERAKRVLAINKYYAAESAKARANNVAHRDALERLVQSKSSNETAYKNALDQIQASKVKLEALSHSRTGALRTALKPSQQAKLISMERAGLL